MKVDLHRTEALVWGMKKVSFIPARGFSNFVCRSRKGDLVPPWLGACGTFVGEIRYGNTNI